MALGQNRNHQQNKPTSQNRLASKIIPKNTIYFFVFRSAINTKTAIESKKTTKNLPIPMNEVFIM